MAEEGLPSPRRSAAGTIMAETVRELREAQRWAAARQATLARSPPQPPLASPVRSPAARAPRVTFAPQPPPAPASPSFVVDMRVMMSDLKEALRGVETSVQSTAADEAELRARLAELQALSVERHVAEARERRAANAEAQAAQAVAQAAPVSYTHLTLPTIPLV